MRRIITIMLVLILALTCFTPTSFAGVQYDSVSLEMQFQDESYGNYRYFNDNESPKFKLLIAYWRGDDIVKSEYIASKNELAFLEENNDSTDAVLRYCGNNLFEIKDAKPKKEVQVQQGQDNSEKQRI